VKNHHPTVLANPYFPDWRLFGQNPETLLCFFYNQSAPLVLAIVSSDIVLLLLITVVYPYIVPTGQFR
jgi:hypothetical protein